MRIKHTSNETYKVYSYLPCKSELFKDIKRWYPYKHYSTKQSALASIKRAKEKHNSIGNKLIWKIVWCPYPFAAEKECITIYNEDIEND